jgi:hypothetical protein
MLPIIDGIEEDQSSKLTARIPKQPMKREECMEKEGADSANWGSPPFRSRGSPIGGVYKIWILNKEDELNGKGSF